MNIKRFNEFLFVVIVMISLLSIISSAYVTFTDDLRYTDTGEVIRK